MEALAAALGAVTAEVVVLVGLARVTARAEVHQRDPGQGRRDGGAENGSVGTAVVDQLHGVGVSVVVVGGQGRAWPT